MVPRPCCTALVTSSLTITAAVFSQDSSRSPQASSIDFATRRAALGASSVGRRSRCADKSLIRRLFDLRARLVGRMTVNWIWGHYPLVGGSKRPGEDAGTTAGSAVASCIT